MKEPPEIGPTAIDVFLGLILVLTVIGFITARGYLP